MCLLCSPCTPRKNYEGFYELHANGTDHIHPDVVFLLPQPLQLNLCGSHCPSYVPKILNRPSYVFDPSIPALSKLTKPLPPPVCTGSDPIPGAYVASTIFSVLYPPVPLPQTKTRPSAGLYDFVQSECTFQHDGLRFRNHDSCLEEKKGVLFIGDSHARAMYDALLHRISGNDTVVQLSAKVPTKAHTLGKLHLVRPSCFLSFLRTNRF